MTHVLLLFLSVANRSLRDSFVDFVFEGRQEDRSWSLRAVTVRPEWVDRGSVRAFEHDHVLPSTRGSTLRAVRKLGRLSWERRKKVDEASKPEHSDKDQQADANFEAHPSLPPSKASVGPRRGLIFSRRLSKESRAAASSACSRLTSLQRRYRSRAARFAHDTGCRKRNRPDCVGCDQRFDRANTASSESSMRAGFIVRALPRSRP